MWKQLMLITIILKKCELQPHFYFEAEILTYIIIWIGKGYWVNSPQTEVHHHHVGQETGLKYPSPQFLSGLLVHCLFPVYINYFNHIFICVSSNFSPSLSQLVTSGICLMLGQ